MPEEEVALLPLQLEAEPVAARPAGLLRTGLRHPHLRDRFGSEHPVVAVQQELREAAQVLRRGPQLPGRGHPAGIDGRFGKQHVRPGVHRPALRVRRLGHERRTVHAERYEHLPAQHLVPALPAHLLDERAQERVAGVGVVVQAPCRVQLGLFAEDVRELGAQGAVRTLPPGSARLGSEAGGVRQQLRERGLAPLGGVSRYLPSGSFRSSRPSSRSLSTSTATKVLVTEPMRYCVWIPGTSPETSPRPALHTMRPSRITAPTSEGVRPFTWPTATRCRSARRVTGSSSANCSSSLVTSEDTGPEAAYKAVMTAP
ncbi:hypothetical protein GCM10020000_40070 [Streptomyces olivoverticillatus]